MNENMLAEYSAPAVDVTSVAVEQGFNATSTTPDLIIKEENWD